LDVPLGQISDIFFDVAIKEDNVFERTEFFSASLSSTSILICPQGTAVEVSITDSTTSKHMYNLDICAVGLHLVAGIIRFIDLEVRFSQSVYRSSNEQGELSVCINVQEGFDLGPRPLTYMIQIMSTTAGKVTNYLFCF
jgi:hypothetical protein